MIKVLWGKSKKESEKYKFRFRDYLLISTAIHVGIIVLHPYIIQGVTHLFRKSESQITTQVTEQHIESQENQRKKLEEELAKYEKKVYSAEDYLHAKSLGIPLSYLNREHHYVKMLTEDIFPTLRLFTDLPSEKSLEGKVETGSQPMQVYLIKTDKSSAQILEEIINSKEPTLPPLHLSDEDMWGIVDELMPMPESQQLRLFKGMYLDRYNPNEGDLPELLKRLYYDNLAIYCWGLNDFQKGIEYFEEKLKDEEFLNFVNSNIEKYHGTRISITLSYMLINQFYDDMQLLLRLFSLYSRAERKEGIQAEVIRRVYEKYRPVLEGNGMDSPEKVKQKYGEKIIEILNEVAEAERGGGHGCNDEYFSIGKIYWDLGKQDLAIESWEKISPEEDFNNGELFQEIREVLDYSKEKDDYVKELMGDDYARKLIDLAFISHKNREDEIFFERVERILWKD